MFARSLFFLVIFTLSTVIKAQTTDDYKKYFPEPIQGWKGTNSSVTFDSGGTVKGWSDEFIFNNQGVYQQGDNPNNPSTPVLLLGFEISNDEYQAAWAAKCSEGLGCGLDPNNAESKKAPMPSEITSIPSPLPIANLSLDGYSIDSKCGSGSSLCHYEKVGTTLNLYIDVNLKSLNANIYGNNMGLEKINIIFSGDLYIDTVELESDGKTEFVFKAGSVLTTSTMVWGYGTIITSESGVLFNIIDSFENEAAPTLTTTNPIFYYAPTGSILIKATKGDAYYGCLIAKKVQLNNDVHIYGAITSTDFDADAGVTIEGTEQCLSETPTQNQNYTIEVTPDSGYFLTCDTPEITFIVRDETGEVATTYEGNIKASFPNGLVPDNQNIKSGSVVDSSNNIYKPTEGIVVVPVSSTEYKSYEITGELLDDSSQSDVGNIEFVPFTFDVDEQYVIANKPKNVTVKALACDTEEKGKVVAVNYEGTPDVQSELEAPVNGIGALSFAPVFTTENEGTIDTSLMFTESGKLKVTLTDDRFNCTGYEGCPIGEDGEANGVLQGSFYVSSRPWTFAICDSNGSAMDGNITDAASQKFTAAGEEFSLYVKPLKWVTGDTDPISGAENINVSTYCDQPITQNVALSNTETAATIILGSALAQPTPERGGVLGTLSGVTSLTNVDSSGSGSGIYYNFANLSWSEVGVLTIQADTQSNYLGMNVNMGYRNIGRFYPDHFTLEGSNLWDYSPNHNGFAYMNQPINMNYTVKAKNRQDGDTENYGLFDASLLAAFNLEAKEKMTSFGVNVFDASLVDRMHLGSDTPVSWDKASYSFSSNDFIFLKKVEESAPYTSTADGPFDDTNAVFGLSVDPSHSTYQNKDEVNFDKDFLATTESFVFPANNGLDDIAVSFVNQPDFRYGRMVLGNVSGPIGGPISVPLRTEYWSGSSFVTNTDDSGSKFKANIYYVMSNHADSGAKLTSTNSANEQSVSAGKSSVLKASQDTPQRETVRLFLRQGNDSDGIGNNATPVEDDELNATNEGWKNAQDMGQPWLQFNWRSKGDEDPSTVVNFGAYRGNDRVIYRGEPNLTVN